MLEISQHHYDHIAREYKNFRTIELIEARARKLVSSRKGYRDYIGNPGYPGLDNPAEYAAQVYVEAAAASAIILNEEEFKIIPDFKNNGDINPDIICKACSNLKKGLFRTYCRLYNIEKQRLPVGF